MANRSELSKAQRCCRVTFNVGLIVAFLFFILIPAMNSYASSWSYAMPPTRWKMLLGFTDLFVAGFGIIYMITAIIVFLRFCHKRRICRMDNCAFYIFTVGVFVLSGIGIEYIERAQETHRNDFSASCAQLALKSGIAEDSFLAEADLVYDNANNLLCSARCPCALRGEVRNLEADNQLRILKYFKDRDGPTSVPKCDSYLDKVYGGDEDK
mmetsp:Transcript_21150/g.26070  ORF Transcript_21150/g.26070 Transcript_21150/m.26070 type:complete len:211 (+) Transcript_21150:37-669(+)